MRFDFDYLYCKYMPTLANDSPYLTNPYSNASILTLTYEGCIEAVGTAAARYSRKDVYDRVILWRIPLIALWATTTFPALGLHTQIFSLMHLVADPIDTFWSLFYKLDLAKRNARWAQETDNVGELYFVFSDDDGTADGNVEGNPFVRTQTAIGDLAQRDRQLNQKLKDRDEDTWQYYQDVVALIIAAYDEWDLGIAASKAIDYGFHHTTPTQRNELRDRCADAAFYIASDRVSSFLPSAVSTLVFLAQIYASFWKTLNALDDTYDDSNPVRKGLNRAPHNIAFGALFFWLPLAVLMTAFVGGSRTSHLVPRVLERFHPDVQSSRASQDEQTPPAPTLADFPDLKKISNERWARGGLPVWQTGKFKKVHKRAARAEGQQNNGRQVDIEEKRPPQKYGLFISITIVAIPTACAMAVSWRTPTEGFGCRALTQLGFLGSRVFNALLDWVFFAVVSGPMFRQVEESAKLKTIYWLTFAKDCFLTCGTITLLTFTALGIFNNCNCWCKWTPVSLLSRKVRYLSFPQQPYVFDQIKYRLQHTFLIIVGCSLLSQIILFIGIAFYFYEGYRVLKQCDTDAAQKVPGFFTRTWRTCTQRLMHDRRPDWTEGPTEAKTYHLDRMPSNDNTPKTPLLSGTASD